MKSFDQDIAYWTQVIQREPRNAQAYAERGSAYRNRAREYQQSGWSEDLDRAIADCSRAINLDSTSRVGRATIAGAYLTRGEAYMTVGDRVPAEWVDRAIVDWDQLILLVPDVPVTLAFAYANRAEAYRRKGDFGRALSDCHRAIKYNPELDFAYRTRGSTYVALEEFERALPDLDQAILLDPTDCRAFFARGVVHLQRKKLDLAVADLTQAIQLGQNTSWNKAVAYYFRAKAYLLRGELDSAIADCNQSLRSGQINTSPYGIRGVAYRLQKKFDLAIADLIKATQSNPGDTWAHEQLNLARRGM